VSKPTLIKPTVDPNLLQLVDNLREAVLDGRVIGCVALMNLRGNEFQHMAAGSMNFSDILLGFESFKFDNLIGRYIVPVKGGA